MAIERPDKLLRKLVVVNRILLDETVLDAFGHVSVRDPENVEVFWLPTALAPSKVTAQDVLPFGLDGEVLAQSDQNLYSERYIHSEIYAARPDVHAICHHHAGVMLPFCVGKKQLQPISQTGAFLGGPVPLWDSTEEFGDTKLLVDNREQAASLARALQDRWTVLMRGHGVTVVGKNLEDLCFKSVYGCREAETYQASLHLGGLTPLTPGEIAKIGQPSPVAVTRAWGHWT
jgi:ribulose-5-phosphate 4-epimerase/fuculose-1-phosphate aldolase